MDEESAFPEFEFDHLNISKVPSEEQFKEELDKKLGPTNPVFQLFSVSLSYWRSVASELYGFIRSDSVCLFDHPPDKCQTLFNKGLLSLSDPHPCRSISAATTIKIIIELFLHVYKEEACKINCEMMCYKSSEESNIFQSTDLSAYYGSVSMNYIILDHPVEATVGVWFETQDCGPMERVYGKIVAYYGDIKKYCRTRKDEKSRFKKARMLCRGHDDVEVDYFRATLFEATKAADAAALLETGKNIPLRRSMLVVPEGGFLVIEAHLFCWDDDKEILSGTYEFPTELKDSSTGSIEGTCCTIDLKVNWKYEGVAGDV